MPPREVVRGREDLRVHRVFTGAADGDLRVDGDTSALLRDRAALAPLPWTWLDQVHGARVVVVRSPGDRAGERADAAVTAVPGATLAVHTADCAGVLLEGGGPGGPVVGAAHAGWRGLVAGVLETTVAAMRDLGARDVRWRLGPCISPAAYEFGESDLQVVARRLGASVRARTARGAPALDLRAGVAAALAGVGAAPADPGAEVTCTATSEGWFSWRARRDVGRQAALTWIAP